MLDRHANFKEFVGGKHSGTRKTCAFLVIASTMTAVVAVLGPMSYSNYVAASETYIVVRVHFVSPFWDTQLLDVAS